MAAAKKPDNAGPSVSAAGSARIPCHGPARQAGDQPDQADGDAARPVARLFAGRRRARARHRRGPEPRLRLHDARQHGGGDLQRHRDPRPRQSRRACLQAGDGGQGGAVQALRRRRFDRPRGRHRERRRVRQLRALPRPVIRRHQSGGHQGAGLLHHRAAAARIDGHPGVPRRPARHRDHRHRRPDQRAGDHRARHEDGKARLQRRGRSRHRLHRAGQVDRLFARERHPLRHQGRRLPGPRGRHEPVEVGACGKDRRALAGRRARRRRHRLRPVRQGRADAGR